MSYPATEIKAHTTCNCEKCGREIYACWCNICGPKGKNSKKITTICEDCKPKKTPYPDKRVAK